MSVLRAFITNLGLYVEGELVGEWIDLPISIEALQEVKKRIRIDELHEEVFFTDYESDLTCFDASCLSEYESIAHLNSLAKKLNKVAELGLNEYVNACLEYGTTLDQAIKLAEDGEVIFIGDDGEIPLTKEEIIGQYYLELCDLDDETREQYIDFEAIGRDERLGYAPQDEGDPETAEEFWCGDADATDYEIGEAVIDCVGFKNLNNPDLYFDLQSYGRDIELDGKFVEIESGVYEIIGQVNSPCDDEEEIDF